MKTKIKFNLMLILLALTSTILITSCTKEEISVVSDSDIPLGMSLKSAEEYGLVCDLIAGQYINVGKVVYSDDEDNLIVEYVATDGWMLKEVHFYAGNMQDFKNNCMNKKAVQIGKFPYSDSNIDAETWSISIPKKDIASPDGDGYLVVAHAVVYKGGQEETAFSRYTCKPLITLKTFFDDGTWGASDGEIFSDDVHSWCNLLGTNIYEYGDIYHFNSWDYDGNAYVEVSDDGENLIVEVFSNGEPLLTRTHLYVGSMDDLLTNFMNGTCPDYENLPYEKPDEEGSASTHTFIIPFAEITATQNCPNSMSFQEAFDIKRWGWLSYYSVN